MRFIRYFPNTSFTEQVLGLFLIFSGKSFLEGMELLTPIYLLWIDNLILLEQFKQEFL